MIKSRGFGDRFVFILLGGSFFLLAFIGSRTESAGRALLSVLNCNGDNVCAYEEWSPKSRPENQPWPDCRPKAYLPLSIDQSGSQIITSGYNTAWSNYKIVQFKSSGAEMLSRGELANRQVVLATPRWWVKLCSG